MITIQETSLEEFNPGYNVEAVFRILSADHVIGYVCTSTGIDKCPFIEWIELFPQYRGKHLFKPIMSSLAAYFKCDKMHLESSADHIEMYRYLGAKEVAYDADREMYELEMYFDLEKGMDDSMQFDFTEDEFQDAYHKILDEIKSEHIPQEKQGVIFLGGQPGSGKSYFYTQDDSLINYVFINGDKYRKYHPHYTEIIAYDLANMAQFTQHFTNRCVEQLIADLSDEGYNMIIEGTLRNPDIPIGTCNMLKAKGYETSLYVMAVDALTSWEATINRVKMVQDIGESPRVVPLNKYNYIVNHFAQNVEIIENEKCFDSIRVINRDNEILYPDNRAASASEVVVKELQLAKWNEVYPQKIKEFDDTKENVIQQQRRVRHGR